MRIQSQHHHRRARGFTLVELTMAIGLAIGMAGIIMTLVQQQVSFLKIARAQNFLVVTVLRRSSWLVSTLGNQ